MKTSATARLWICLLATIAVIAAGLGAGLSTASAAPSGLGLFKWHGHQVCTTTPAPGHAACHAEILVNSQGTALASATPPATALTAGQLENAYKLTGLTSGGRTIAIVDAYGYPNLERDLGVFRAQFGLPACTKANGCLRILNQSGGAPNALSPAFNAGWGGEQALDVQAVSAACPDCKIVMVEANNTSFASLGAAENTAAKQPGVVAISNSYGGGDSSDATYSKFYNHPGIAVTASTGDDGYQGASYPASSQYVTAVGGTTLVADISARGWSESVWSGAGSGCSTVNAALAAAAPFSTGCAKRAMADVAAAADPAKGGLAVYYPTSRSASTWGQIGGTSEAAPIIAAVYALSGNTTGYANALPYAHPGNLFDVTTGSNGTCPTVQWCTARAGWDGPTGLGTPNGASGF
ncbi:MAG: peptidase [Marmoricola sp.]|nr:peptidase [Marmoricola sp.]